MQSNSNTQLTVADYSTDTHLHLYLPVQIYHLYIIATFIFALPWIRLVILMIIHIITIKDLFVIK